MFSENRFYSIAGTRFTIPSLPTPEQEPLIPVDRGTPEGDCGGVHGKGEHVYKIIYRGFLSRLGNASKALKRLVGPPRFELGTSCTPSKRASQAAPRPDPLERPYSIRLETARRGSSFWFFFLRCHSGRRTCACARRPRSSVGRLERPPLLSLCPWPGAARWNDRHAVVFSQVAVRGV